MIKSVGGKFASQIFHHLLKKQPQPRLKNTKNLFGKQKFFQTDGEN